MILIRCIRFLTFLVYLPVVLIGAILVVAINGLFHIMGKVVNAWNRIVIGRKIKPLELGKEDIGLKTKGGEYQKIDVPTIATFPNKYGSA